MIWEFASLEDVRRNMPPRLPRNSACKYLYLLRPKKSPQSVKVGITCYLKSRMCEWYYTPPQQLLVAGPFADARQRELQFIKLGHEIGRLVNGLETFSFSEHQLPRFIEAFRLAGDEPQLDYEI